MKIAIISDLHDNLVNLEKCLVWCQANNIQEIICCGDVTNTDTLSFLSSRFPSTIHLARGNMEIFYDEEVEQFSNIKYYGRAGGIFNIEDKKIGICHEPYLIDNLLSDNPDIIFYGHTHKPWIEKKNNTKIVNPGTLAGMFQKATFAFWDTSKDKLELKILENLDIK